MHGELLTYGAIVHHLTQTVALELALDAEQTGALVGLIVHNKRRARGRVAPVLALGEDFGQATRMSPSPSHLSICPPRCKIVPLRQASKQ